MRLAAFSKVLSTLLLFCATAALGFEVEDRRVFPATSESSVLRIISTADTDAFQPLIEGYQKENPGITVDYTLASSTELMRAIYTEQAPFDLAISSAMDLQVKIANDGFAQTYSSAATNALPPWAKWREQVFAFTQEPAVLVVSDAEFGAEDPPRNREELINLLRDQPDRFRGRVGTYDVRTSGSGYLFATQDSRNSESYWRLTEVMGGLDARLYCCSSDMIADVASGKLAIAYNVVGSYAETRLADTDGFSIVALDDFLSVMLRTALIPTNAENVSAAQGMIDYLTTLPRPEPGAPPTGLPPLDPQALAANNALRPIRLGPGLLVFLDRLKRETFLRSWTNAIEQP